MKLPPSLPQVAFAVLCLGMGACVNSSNKPSATKTARVAPTMMKTESIDGTGSMGGPGSTGGPGGIGSGSNSGSGTGSMSGPGTAAAATLYTGGR